MAYDASNIYFAAKPSTEIGRCLQDKVDKYYEVLRYSEVFARQARAYRQYYGKDDRGNSSFLNQGGENGETWSPSSNEFRAKVQRVVVLTTAARLNFETRSRNTDASQEAVNKVARAQIEHYMADGKLEEKLFESQEISQLLGEVYGVVEWDPGEGDELLAADPETGAPTPIKGGDNLFKIFLPVDVVRDVARMDVDSPWYITREWVNKYDLAAQYPAVAEKILAYSFNQMEHLHYYGFGWNVDYSDLCPLYTFYHKKTPALPGGRVVQFVSGEAVLWDLPLPYSDLPIIRGSVGKVYGAWWGHTNSFDALGVEDLHNALFTAVASNNMNNALQLLFLPQGSNITPENVIGGAKVVYHPPGFEPKAGQLTASAPETYKLMELAGQKGASTLGLNDLAMGNLPYAGIPAELASIMTAQAVQFNKAAERSYAGFAQQMIFRALRNIGEFAAGERRVHLLGKHDAALLDSYNPQMLAQLSEVIVTLSSAVTRTEAGKLTELNYLMQAQTPEQQKMVMAVLETGTYEPALEPSNDLELLLQWERQQLANPAEQIPIPTPFDDHMLHIENARKVLYMPSARTPEVLQRVMQYVQQCMQAAQESVAMGLPLPPSAQAAQQQAQQNAPAPQADQPAVSGEEIG